MVPLTIDFQNSSSKAIDTPFKRSVPEFEESEFGPMTVQTYSSRPEASSSFNDKIRDTQLDQEAGLRSSDMQYDHHTIVSTPGETFEAILIRKMKEDLKNLKLILRYVWLEDKDYTRNLHFYIWDGIRAGHSTTLPQLHDHQANEETRRLEMLYQVIAESKANQLHQYHKVPMEIFDTDNDVLANAQAKDAAMMAANIVRSLEMRYKELIDQCAKLICLSRRRSS